MANSRRIEKWRVEKGQVLWGLLVLLGMLTELALSSLQLAAQEGISVRLFEQQLQDSQRLQVIAEQLSLLPVPLRSAQLSLLWHPLASTAQQGCGSADRHSYVEAGNAASCTVSSQSLLASARTAGEWQWRLRRIGNDPALIDEGSDMSAFPGLQAQSWQLEVVLGGRAGAPAQGMWQRYRQVSP